MPVEKEEISEKKDFVCDLSPLVAVVKDQTEALKQFKDKLDKNDETILSSISDYFEKKYKEIEDQLLKTREELGTYKNAYSSLLPIKKEKENWLIEKNNLEQQIAESKGKVEGKEELLKEKDKQIKELFLSVSEKDKSLENLKGRIKEISDKTERLEHELSEKEDLCNGLNALIKDMQNDNNLLKDDLETAKRDADNYMNKALREMKSMKTDFDSIKSKLDNYESLKIDKLERAYTLFISFKERTRNNLKAVFETESFLGFISNSMQWERIAGIWEQAKRKVVNDDNEDFIELRELFLILFETYNAGYLDAPYELITPEIGTKYNSNEQLIKNQKSDGKITKILLEGYVFKKNNTIHKAMIEVE